ncbi:hypothetical protein Tco_0801004 [Tanacetum coccineum]|uniref:Uncharacterized protein n=1 Tax=Tanacetum coccineum TaxID=301880 RepID=A0ABQ4ZXG3_9ASTR
MTGDLEGHLEVYIIISPGVLEGTSAMRIVIGSCTRVIVIMVYTHRIPGLYAELKELMKDQLLLADASPIALSPDYIFDSDPEEDDEEDPEEDPVDYPARRETMNDNESSK